MLKNCAARFSCTIEPLEPRRLLSGGPDPSLTFVQYYPEGYVSANVSEFVPITNPNDEPVGYQLWARYEWGERDQMLAAGVFPPHTRAGVTISYPPGEVRIVRPDTPFALELYSTAPLAAMLSHYDFGTAVGEAFTSTTSAQWTFSQGFKRSDTTRQFIVFHNPNDVPATVTMTLYNGGVPIVMSQTLQARRRGGWSLDGDGRVPVGPFGIRLTADHAIVAALSHYEIQSQRGYGVLGQPDFGAQAGVLTAVEFLDPEWDGSPSSGEFVNDIQGDDTKNPSGAFRGNSYITILNPTALTAEVTLSFLQRDTTGSGLLELTVMVPPQNRRGLSVRDLGLPLVPDIAMIYTSTVPVTVAATVYQGEDGTGLMAATYGASEWYFGEGFMNRDRAGTSILENLYVFNPTTAPATVTVELILTDGSILGFNSVLRPLEVADFKLHEYAPLLEGYDFAYFGVMVSSTAHIVAGFEHWDDFQGGGGFQTFGLFGGDVVDLLAALAE